MIKLLVVFIAALALTAGVGLAIGPNQFGGTSVTPTQPSNIDGPLPVPSHGEPLRQNGHVVGVENDGTYRFSVVTGTSMVPILSEGFRLITKPYSLPLLQAGDIVVVNDCLSGATIVHQVKVVDQDGGGPYIITQGAANRHQDLCQFRQDRLVGLVVGVLY